MAEASARRLDPRIDEPRSDDVARLAALAALAAVPGWSAASLAASLAADGAIARVARDAAGAPIGLALAQRAADELEIRLVAVAIEQRRRGVGARLVASVLEAARDAAVAHLEVRAGNAAAIALYERAGFVAAGRRPRYYEGREDAVAMRRAIAENPA